MKILDANSDIKLWLNSLLYFQFNNGIQIVHF